LIENSSLFVSLIQRISFLEISVVQTRLALSGDENSFQKTAIEAPEADQIPNTNGSSKFLFPPPTQCILHLLKEPGAEELETLVSTWVSYHHL
jgi:hypothetical protein